MSVRATRRPRARGEAGFSLVELLVTVVIIGIAAALSWPTLRGDNRQVSGEGFARSVMREMQRVRSQAIGETLRMRVHFYSDHVEVRSWTRGSTTGPDTSTQPLRTLYAPQQVIVAQVAAKGTAAPTAGNLSGTPAIDFNTNGSTVLVGGTIGTPTSIWIINQNLKGGDRRLFKIDVNALTGFSHVYFGAGAVP